MLSRWQTAHDRRTPMRLGVIAVSQTPRTISRLEDAGTQRVTPHVMVARNLTDRHGRGRD
jgi:hypothetical protein